MQSEVMLAQIQDYLQKSNEGSPGMAEDIIEAAGERFKEILSRTFNQDRRAFRVSMSNSGRPACQLVMERDGVLGEKKDAAFRMKMLIGDVVEILLRAVMESAGVKIMASNQKVSLPLDEYITVRGELDFDIGGYVWDAKTASNWSFKNKWKAGFDHIEQYDDFGYCAQLYGYAEAKGVKAGGWIVVNKETGDLAVVPAKDTPKYRKKHIDKLTHNVYKVLDTERPFTREFEDEEETFYGKPTGNRVLGFTCSWCDWKTKCWPNLVKKPQAKSKAKNPKMVWYTEYHEETDEAKVEEEQRKTAAKPAA